MDPEAGQHGFTFCSITFCWGTLGKIFTCLGVSFLIWKMEIILLTYSQVCWDGVNKLKHNRDSIVLTIIVFTRLLKF